MPGRPCQYLSQHGLPPGPNRCFGEAMKKQIALLTALTIAFVLAACGSDGADEPSSAATEPSSPERADTAPAESGASSADSTPITITVGDRKIQATLNDSDVAQDFAESLPVNLKWFRNSGIEYITELDSPADRDRPLLHQRPARRHRLLQPARRHHDHLRGDQLGPDPDEDGRSHVRPERLRRAPGQHRNAHRSPVATRPDAA